MSLANLKNIQANYDNTYFGQSDRLINKQLLDAIISALETMQGSINTNDEKIDDLEERIDTLEEQMENRMLCKNYKEE